MPDISTILILTHSNTLSLQGYFLALLVKEWEARGIRVMIHHDLESWCPPTFVWSMSTSLSSHPGI